MSMTVIEKVTMTVKVKAKVKVKVMMKVSDSGSGSGSYGDSDSDCDSDSDSDWYKITWDVRDLWLSTENFHSLLRHHPLIRYQSTGHF